MRTRPTTITLSAAVIGLAAFATLSPVDRQVSASPALGASFEPAFITVYPPPSGGPVAVSNPRAGRVSGGVFYVTDITTGPVDAIRSEFTINVRMPPELGDSDGVLVSLFNGLRAGGSWHKHQASFNTPIPVASTITIDFDAPSEQSLVLGGFYSPTRPDVTIVGP